MVNDSKVPVDVIESLKALKIDPERAQFLQEKTRYVKEVCKNRIDIIDMLSNSEDLSTREVIVIGMCLEACLVRSEIVAALLK